MAGIGFALRRLSRRGDLLGIVQAYAHSAAASTGPWLFTILCLAALTVVALPYVGSLGVTTFRVIVTYNFAFSLVFTGPIVRVVTRCLADQIYEQDVKDAPGMLIGALLLGLIVQAPFAVGFYFFYIDLPVATQVHAVVNYFLTASLWIVGVYLTALKVYIAVSATFGVGLALAFGLSVLGAQLGSLDGMLMGFNAGLAVILFALVARTFAEYPYPPRRIFAWVRHFRGYWSLAVSGLLYNMAIWIDKWVMWFAPERQTLPSGFIHYGIYDGAMFLAFLSIVPSMATFVLNLETGFYERYMRFYRDIQHHATLDRILSNHRAILAELLSGIRNLIVFQATVSLLCIVFAPEIFDLLGINYLWLGIFRFGVLGAFFHTLFLVLTIILSYFDLRGRVLALNVILLTTNFGFTYIAMQQGFSDYGYGYFAAALFSFLLGALITFRELFRVPYHAFVTHPAAD